MASSLTSFKSVVISGGSGFVGVATARAFAERFPECTITIIDLNPRGPAHTLPDGAPFLRVDVTSFDEINKALQQTRPDVVIHGRNRSRPS
ncbi:hypothetical protein BDW59DRAFT_149424 [Aspergillus cavernicola]|uniref:NAD-dependent epimerase/dehydratase domain-containing protein n=1 Tax=Aspergillus cavernicola TaxID=176166 RepID=A0ABR4I4S2_9EURO